MPHFLVITAKSISGMIFVIWGHPQGQKVNFKVKYILPYVPCEKVHPCSFVSSIYDVIWNLILMTT